ncbi:MAG: PEP-CTERM sorting domain-containing protein [Pirellulales bacterium]|nr:PEP-CTERM sorting domain-containing protein [Pirellulales bacterium]
MGRPWTSVLGERRVSPICATVPEPSTLVLLFAAAALSNSARRSDEAVTIAAQTAHLRHGHRVGRHHNRERRIDLQGVVRGRAFPELSELQLGDRSLRQRPDEL